MLFLFLYRTCKTINKEQSKHSWSNTRISLLFAALAVLLRTIFTKHKHWVLVKDLGPVSQKSRNFSDLFRVPQFTALYHHIAGVLSHQHCQKFGSKWRTRVRIESLMAAKSCKEMYGISKKIQNTTTTTHKIP